MENNQILIPEGWTYFVHRTNTERWQGDPFNNKSIILTRLMSVITEYDIYQEVEHYGKNHAQGYSSGKGTPFEIRCLICELPYLRIMNSGSEIKTIMLNNFYYDKLNFGGAGGQRHHSIPKGEELIVIGIGEYDEITEKNKKIIWTISKRFLEFYKQEIMKNNNRIIGLRIKFDEISKKR